MASALERVESVLLFQSANTHSQTPPTLSEPFDNPLPSKEPPLASTPLPASAMAGTQIPNDRVHTSNTYLQHTYIV